MTRNNEKWGLKVIKIKTNNTQNQENKLGSLRKSLRLTNSYLNELKAPERRPKLTKLEMKRAS